MQDILEQLVKETSSSKYSNIRQSCQNIQEMIKLTDGNEKFYRDQCLDCLQLCLESKNTRIAGLSLTGIQLISGHPAFRDDDGQLPPKILSTLKVTPQLPEELQMEVMKMLLVIAFDPSFPTCPSLITGITDVLEEAYRASCQTGIKTAVQATLIQLVTTVASKMSQSDLDEDLSSVKVEHLLENNLTAVDDVIAVLDFLCAKLDVSNCDGLTESLLLEAILALLNNLAASIRNNECFVELVWRRLCPSLIALMGNPISDKTVTAVKNSFADDLGRGSGCSTSAPTITTNASRTIGSILCQLVRLVGPLRSLRPVLESLLHRMLLYPPPGSRLCALKTCIELIDKPAGILNLAGPTIDDGNTTSAGSNKRRPHSDVALLKLLIDSAKECAACGESSVAYISVELIVKLLAAFSALVAGEGISEVFRKSIIYQYKGDQHGEIETSLSRIFSSNESSDTETESADTDTDEPAGVNREKMEKFSADLYFQLLKREVPKFLKAQSIAEVDRLLMQFSSLTCSALLNQSDESPGLNADGVYLTTICLLTLNLRLVQAGYFQSDEKSLPMTEQQFVDDVLNQGLLVYLSPIWLAEVYHALINTDILSQAGYGTGDYLLSTPSATAADIQIPIVQLLLDIRGLDSRLLRGQLLTIYQTEEDLEQDSQTTEAGRLVARRCLSICWNAIIDILSSLLNDRSVRGLSGSLNALLTSHNENRKARNAILQSLEGLHTAAKLTCILGLQERCGAVFGLLASSSCVADDKDSAGLPSVHALTLDLVLSMGLEMGSHAADCWPHVFQCCLQVSQLEHNIFSGNNPAAPKLLRSHNELMPANEGEELMSVYASPSQPSQLGLPTVSVKDLIEQDCDSSKLDGILSLNQTSLILCNLSQQVDRLFDDACLQLNMNALSGFMRELCFASKRLLSNKRLSGLYIDRLHQCLLKVANSNRPMLHLVHVWATVSPHLVETSCHRDVQLARKAVDCIHQFVTFILSRQSELEFFHFNELLCKPFENLLCLELCDGDIQDQVVCSICEMVETCATEIRSGWRPLFAALRAVKVEFTANEEVNDARQRHVTAVMDVFDAFLNTDNIFVFSNAALECVQCLLRHVRGSVADSTDTDSDDECELSANLCLPALAYLKQCCEMLCRAYLMPACPPFNTAKQIRFNVVVRCVQPLVLPIDIDEFQKPFNARLASNGHISCELEMLAAELKLTGRNQSSPLIPTPPVSPSRQDWLNWRNLVQYRPQQLPNDGSGVLQIYLVILEGLASTLSTCPKNYQPKTLEAFFEILRSAKNQPGPTFCLYCANHLLLPMLQAWLRRGNQIPNYWKTSLANFKQCCGLATDLIVEYIITFADEDEHVPAVEFLLKQLLDMQSECIAQPLESLSRLGCSCIRHCLISVSAVLSEQAWYLVSLCLYHAFQISLAPIRQLMTPFHVNSENFYGDIGQVKVAIRKDGLSIDGQRLQQLAHQVFFLDEQKSSAECVELAAEDEIAYVFLISPPSLGSSHNDEELTTRVPFQNVVVGLLAHQLLIQLVAGLLVPGKTQTQTQMGTASYAADNFDVLSSRTVINLLSCLWESFNVSRDFDGRPGLKFLLQKVAGAKVAANLYRPTASSLTAYVQTLLQITSRVACVSLQNTQDLLAEMVQQEHYNAICEEAAESRRHVHEQVGYFLQQLKQAWDVVCTTYVDMYIDQVGESPADRLSHSGLEFLAAEPQAVDMLQREKSVQEMVQEKLQERTESSSKNTLVMRKIRQAEEDKVYEIVSEDAINDLIHEYKRHKKSQVMPPFQKADRSKPKLARQPPPSGPEPGVAEQQKTSVMRDVEAQFYTWICCITDLLQMTLSLDDIRFQALLPASFECVNQLMCRCQDERLRCTLGQWTHRLGLLHGIVPPQSPPNTPLAPHFPMTRLSSASSQGE